MNKDNQSIFNENDFLKFLKCKLDVKREGIWKVKYFFLHFGIVSFIRLAVFGLMYLFTQQSSNIIIWERCTSHKCYIYVFLVFFCHNWHFIYFI